MISQIILDNTKLTPGHITSILVVFGAFLDTFSIYDLIIKYVGGGIGQHRASWKATFHSIHFLVASHNSTTLADI